MRGESKGESKRGHGAEDDVEAEDGSGVDTALVSLLVAIHDSCCARDPASSSSTNSSGPGASGGPANGANGANSALATLPVQSSATPRDYVSFLQTWHRLYTLQKQALLTELRHLQKGLFKLDSAAEVPYEDPNHENCMIPIGRPYSCVLYLPSYIQCALIFFDDSLYLPATRRSVVTNELLF